MQQNEESATRSLKLRGVELTEEQFELRHRFLLWVLVVHIPLLSLASLWWPSTEWSEPAYESGLLTWGLIAFMCAMVLSAVVQRSQATRGASVSVGLVIGSAALVHIFDGLTDMHLHFFVMAALISLYQAWLPFMAGVVFVATHHVGMALWMPEMIFSVPLAQEAPLAFALLHAAFFLAECGALILAWRFTQRADDLRLDADRRAMEAEEARELARASAAELEQARADQAARTEAALAAQALIGERMTEVDAFAGQILQQVTASHVQLESLTTVSADIGTAATDAAASVDKAVALTEVNAALLTELDHAVTQAAAMAEQVSKIAGQTNLLALNASIEATRAGDSGKGFAVVAGEVKELARETAAVTEAIGQTLDGVQRGATAVGANASGMVEVLQVISQRQGEVGTAALHGESASKATKELMHDVAEEMAKLTGAVKHIASLDR